MSRIVKINSCSVSTSNCNNYSRGGDDMALVPVAPNSKCFTVTADGWWQCNNPSCRFYNFCVNRMLIKGSDGNSYGVGTRFQNKDLITSGGDYEIVVPPSRTSGSGYYDPNYCGKVVKIKMPPGINAVGFADHESYRNYTLGDNSLSFNFKVCK